MTSEGVLTYAWFIAGVAPGHAWVPGLHLYWTGSCCTPKGGSIAAAAAVMVHFNQKNLHMLDDGIYFSTCRHAVMFSDVRC